MTVEHSFLIQRKNAILQHALADVLADPDGWVVSSIPHSSEGDEVVARLYRKDYLETPDEIANDHFGVKSVQVWLEVEVRTAIAHRVIPDTEAEEEEYRKQRKAKLKAERKAQKQAEREAYQQSKGR